ncbi:Bacteriophage holin family protein [Flavobacterium fluvii]|uniref:Bacteriophage holin family protein n=2 Tax=Flavobacterium fluvii TaxID=468056 RepID=A0A1M5P8Y3_9FLAO|nr:Bacteriophage holin family protein [Flavobacterium fluvii]
MRIINYFFKGFGFVDLDEFLKSAFGFIYTSIPIIKIDLLMAFMLSSVSFLFGFNHLFLIAYVVLLVSEWYTGVQASLKRGERHESRKFGRMILKIATYLVPIYILNTFAKNSDFLKIMDVELDPFAWLYWAVLLGIIWQLLVSLLENLDSLGVKYAKTLIRIINKKFYKQFELDEDNSTT